MVRTVCVYSYGLVKPCGFVLTNIYQNILLSFTNKYYYFLTNEVNRFTLIFNQLRLHISLNVSLNSILSLSPRVTRAATRCVRFVFRLHAMFMHVFFPSASIVSNRKTCLFLQKLAIKLFLFFNVQLYVSCKNVISLPTSKQLG